MNTGYLDFVYDGMNSALDFIQNPSEERMLLASTMTRFFNCDNIFDFSQTFQINKDSIYKSIDATTPSRLLRRIQKRGRIRLLKHLKKWKAKDPSYRTRHAITLCADDFTRTARGGIGSWAGLFYSGAEGRVVSGINIEALVAVIGDGSEVIILDVRIVPPKPKAQGGRPMNRNDWLRKALDKLDTFLRQNGTNIKGCSLSVDAAYVSYGNAEKAKDLGITLVSKLSANRRIDGWPLVNVMIDARTDVFARFALLLNLKKRRFLRGETGVSYFRTKVTAQSLEKEILLVTFLNERGEVGTYFSTDLEMKTITLRNVVRYRWQLERVFWILKQDIGIGDIHHQRKARTETRIYLHFILAQVTRDASSKFKVSPKTIVRNIRRNPFLLLFKLGFPSAFVHGQFQETPSSLPEAA